MKHDRINRPYWFKTFNKQIDIISGKMWANTKHAVRSFHMHPQKGIPYFPLYLFNMCGLFFNGTTMTGGLYRKTKTALNLSPCTHIEWVKRRIDAISLTFFARALCKYTHFFASRRFHNFPPWKYARGFVFGAKSIFRV